MRNAQAKITKEHLDELLDVLRQAVRDKKFLVDFLSDLLTPTELNEIVARWQIVKRLAKGMSQREISKQLHVTLVTINRGMRVLQNPRGGFNQMFKNS